MKASFWDVKKREKVEVEVKECVKFANGRYAFKAETEDGRSLTRFVSNAEAEAFNGGKAPAKAAGKCCKKSCKK